MGIRFCFQIRVLETLTSLSNAPSRQNPLGSSVKTLKSQFHYQEAHVLLSTEPTWSATDSVSPSGGLSSNQNAQPTPGRWRNVPGCQCPGPSLTRGTGGCVEHPSFLIPQGDTADVLWRVPSRTEPHHPLQIYQLSDALFFCFGFFFKKKN